MDETNAKGIEKGNIADKGKRKGEGRSMKIRKKKCMKRSKDVKMSEERN